MKHVWESGSCDKPKTCVRCNTTLGTAQGHTWVEATLTEPKKCSSCGETEGSALNTTLIGQGVINTEDDSLNLRKGPDLSSEILTKIPKGTSITLYSCDNSDWYVTEFSGKTGYVSSKYVSLGNNQSGSTGYLGIGTVKTKGSPLYIRNAKVYTEESKLGQIPNGNKVNVYDCGDSKWYRVEYNGITGYASAEFIILGSTSSGSSSGSSSSTTLQDICNLLAENARKEGHNETYEVTKSSNGTEYITVKNYSDNCYDSLTAKLQAMKSYTVLYDQVGYDNVARDYAKDMYKLHLEYQDINNNLCKTILEMCEYVGLNTSVHHYFYDSDPSYTTPVYISVNGYESWDVFDELMESNGYYYP